MKFSFRQSADTYLYVLVLLVCLASFQSTAITMMLLSLTLLLWILKLDHDSLAFYRTDALVTAVTVLIVVRFLPFLFSVAPFTSLAGSRKLIPLLLFYPAYLAVRNERRRTVFMVAAICSCVAASIYGIGVAFFGVSHRAMGPSSGAYTLATLQAMVFPFTLWLLVESSSRYRKALAAGAMIVILISLAATLCRAQVGAVVIVILTAAYVSRKRVWLYSLVAVVGVTAATPALRDRIVSALGGVKAAFPARWELWSQGLELFAKRPLRGYGMGTFKEIFPRELLSQIPDAGLRSWHNDVMQVAIEGGVIALVALLLLLWLYFRALRSVARDAASVSTTAFYLGLGLLAFFVTFLFGHLLGDPMVSPFAFLCLGCFARSCRRS